MAYQAHANQVGDVQLYGAPDLVELGIGRKAFALRGVCHGT